MKAALALVAAMLASGLHSATGEAAGTLPGSSSAPVAAENPVATAPAPVVGNASPAPVRAKVAALAKPAYELIFTPLTALPAQVKAPSVKQTAAFAALNALLRDGTRLSEDVIGMGVSLQRAQAASCGTCARPTPVPTTPGSQPAWSRASPPCRRAWPGRSWPTR